MQPVSDPRLSGSLTPAASTRGGQDPIFAIHAEALRRAAEGQDVIDGSLGALIEDDGILAVLPAVFDAYASIDPRTAAGYAPIAGHARFLEAVRRDVFDGSPLLDSSVAVATAGGTGAIHHAVVNFLEPGQAMYTSRWYWGPYRTIAEHTGREVETYEMFTAEGRLDLDAFTKGLQALVQRQGRALVILNSPCHNPTGYSLDEFEWKRVVEELRRAAQQGPVTLLVDLAYARYGAPGAERWVEYVAPLLGEVPVLVAWSASKSFAQYGARVGALVAVVADEEERAQVRAALAHSCRGTWSNCNHLGMAAIARLLDDPEQRARADRDRARLVRTIRERVDAFNEAASKVELRYPRYEGGFFVSVFTDDPKAVAARCAEENLFLVPIDGAVRIALCAIPADRVPRVVDVLARAITR